MTMTDPHALLAEAEALAEMAAREPWTPAVEKARTLVPALCAALREALAENERLDEALKDATAHLVGSACAYRKHAARHRSVGRAVSDPFFSTRVEDFQKAADRATAALAARRPS